MTTRYHDSRELLIACTDAGDDPDDAVALALLAFTTPEFAVLTTDEYSDYRRAAFVRYFLDLLGRPDVPVIPGEVTGGRKHWAAEGLAPSRRDGRRVGWQSFLTGLSVDPEQRLLWAGFGPMTELAWMLSSDVTAQSPAGVLDRTKVVQMGGWYRTYRDPSRAEHNLRADPRAARYVVDSGVDLTLVLSDTTWRTEIAVHRDSEIYRLLAASTEPWARLLVAHYDQWFQVWHSSSRLHDPLALWALLRESETIKGSGRYVDFEQLDFRMEADGRMVSGTECSARVSVATDYAAFMEWVRATLSAGGPLGWALTRSVEEVTGPIAADALALNELLTKLREY
ncbi:nucleoside hydrolase [Nocardia callitridis]|uniref:Inosine/uridine-preferring nucleoside hydrolase domain-containing protein n=1 Tax=Nocardia callitridis TaxID=648753 RepID=A0ABP9KI08_9NOCA